LRVNAVIIEGCCRSRRRDPQ